MNTETNSTVLRDERKAPPAKKGASSPYLKRHNGPDAIPFLNVVEDREGTRLQRYGDGWFQLVPGTMETSDADPVETLELKFPVRQLRRRGVVFRTRQERREDAREEARVGKKRVQRQVRAAEARREEKRREELEERKVASRLQANEDREAVLHGEELEA